MKITKRMHWIMGHRLTFHKGGCYNPHGHNYEVKISVEGKQDENGFVCDFSEIKKMFKEKIHDPWDHSFMVWEKDGFGIYMKEASDNFSKYDNQKRPFKIVTVPFETTAENIAKEIKRLFDEAWEGRAYFVNRVKVYETPTSEAVCYGKNL